MTSDQQQAILTLALFAAFADGVNDDEERRQIRELAQSLAQENSAVDVSRLYRDVLLHRVSPARAAAVLRDDAQRRFAFEMAVCVCEVDGPTNAAERHFLAGLKQLLGLEDSQSATAVRDAEAVADLARRAAPAVANNDAPLPDEVALDRSILNGAIINGALELLPQSWASMAVVPLQIRMVYRIGRAYGVELDQGHIREFIATAGIGLTAQYLEQFARKLLGQLLNRTGGETARYAASLGAGAAVSFATTYALGQVAKQYYSGGRVMDGATLRRSFRALLGPARRLQVRYLPQIQQRAGRLDSGHIMALVRGH